MKTFLVTMDLAKPTNNPTFQVKKQEVNSITIQGTILNNDVPEDLTGSAVVIAVLTPNKTNFSQACTITSALTGEIEVLLDEAAYATLGEHQAQFRITTGTEINITDSFYYESIDAIPV